MNILFSNNAFYALSNSKGFTASPSLSHFMNLCLRELTPFSLLYSPLDTPKRMIEKREREKDREKGRRRDIEREGGRDKRERERERWKGNREREWKGEA